MELETLSMARQEEIFRDTVLQVTKPILETKEVEEQYNVSEKILKEWRTDGLRWSKPGGKYKYFRKDIEAYLQRYAFTE